MASNAPLRIWRPLKSMPDMRVCAENGTNTASCAPNSRPADAELLLGEHDDRPPFGRLVGQRGELRRVGQRRIADADAGRNSVAWRLPSVIVPVLSSSSVSTSPAASTDGPDIASTLCWTSRSMPAMPIAEISAPIVVGIRQTRSAMSTGIGISVPA